MARESRFGRTGATMRVTGKIIKLMVKVD